MERAFFPYSDLSYNRYAISLFWKLKLFWFLGNYALYSKDFNKNYIANCIWTNASKVLNVHEWSYKSKNLNTHMRLKNHYLNPVRISGPTFISSLTFLVFFDSPWWEMPIGTNFSPIGSVVTELRALTFWHINQILTRIFTL